MMGRAWLVSLLLVVLMAYVHAEDGDSGRAEPREATEAPAHKPPKPKPGDDKARPERFKFPNDGKFKHNLPPNIKTQPAKKTVKRKPGEREKWEEEEHHGKVHWLDDDNFEEFHAKTPHFMVFFYAPWCHHCKHFKEAYGKASQELHGTYPLTAVNCMNEHKICDKFKIHGYPHIQYFSYLGDGEGRELRLKKEDRTADYLVDWVRKQLKQYEKTKEEEEAKKKPKVIEEEGEKKDGARDGGQEAKEEL
eukprot:gb/GEZN01017045.1/.p1 GENE.gb/GEZN01017045.1/~~gb/GEZN01017045.1/.p1  ORF type:complete len:249 (+),score=60.29 gb/GEZN01017045.1/:25-771(+)